MGVQFCGLVTAQFIGNNGPGAISVPGLEVGDIVVAFKEGPLAPAFETAISIADEIQQTTSTDFSALTLHAVLFRGSFS